MYFSPRYHCNHSDKWSFSIEALAKEKERISMQGSMVMWLSLRKIFFFINILILKVQRTIIFLNNCSSPEIQWAVLWRRCWSWLRVSLQGNWRSHRRAASLRVRRWEWTGRAGTTMRWWNASNSVKRWPSSVAMTSTLKINILKFSISSGFFITNNHHNNWHFKAWANST